MKLKRLLTAALSAVMALSVCALPAMADDTTTAATPKTSTSTIDTSLKGSITIHKYLQENPTENGDGTGEDNQTPPSGAEAAEGVGFTVYQVMSTADLLKYYNGEGDTVTIDTYANVAANTLKDTVTAIKTLPEAKTNPQGEVKFKGLDIGLYVVIETSKPASVTEAVKPFLVSIPMTRKGDVKKGEEWLYDVVVYPKNSTKTGDFTLKKYGVIGSDKTSKVGLEGVQFKLEHLKDGIDYNTATESVTTNWVQIKPKATTGTAQEDYFVTDVSGEISVEDLKPGTYRFTEIGYAERKDNKYIINKNDQYVFVVNADGTTASIPATAKHQGDYTVDGNTVSVYNYVPDVNKQVKKGDTWQKAADFNVGDKIDYKIEVTIPENIDRLKTFTVTDTPKNLTDDVNSVKVKNGNSEIDNTANSVYTVNKSGADGFAVNFVPGAMAAYKGKTLTITYIAELNKTAVSTTDGNSNTVKLDYSNNVKQEGDTTPDTTKTVQDEAVVYTFKISINKIADDADKTPLENVEFDLYKQVKKGATGAITDADAKALGLDTVFGWVRVNNEVNASNEHVALKTDTNGKLEVNGLENGIYKLVETKTHDGYNLLKEPVDVTLSIAYKTIWTKTDTYNNGVWVKSDVTQKNETFDADHTAAPGEAMNGGTQSGVGNIGMITKTIINRKGFNLPVTGGFGTLLFSGIGVLLVLAGVSVLFSLKKKNNRA